ncbi:hypothetical protein ACFVTM_08805 [Arthrobacter sp. NPDC058130]|uniref:hypothetical protein n=1 Tax=Arthrobacter sp. NPDC058130 TaxID=3346353 RepID=UPI0036E544E7
MPLMVLVGTLLAVALSGCAGPAEAAGLSAADKEALDNPLFSAELVVYGICPPTTTKFDDDATRCAAVLYRTGVNIAKVHSLVRQRGVHDDVLDGAAQEIGSMTDVCDGLKPSGEIRACLNTAEKVKTNAVTYVKTLRAKLDAVK